MAFPYVAAAAESRTELERTLLVNIFNVKPVTSGPDKLLNVKRVTSGPDKLLNVKQVTSGPDKLIQLHPEHLKNLRIQRKKWLRTAGGEIRNNGPIPPPQPSPRLSR